MLLTHSLAPLSLLKWESPKRFQARGSLVKQQVKDFGGRKRDHWVVIDGPPGTGCPVIAALSGAVGALIVTQPSLSGPHDAKKVIAVARRFDVPVKLIFNQFDLDMDLTADIVYYSSKENIPIAGKIPFVKRIVESVTQGLKIVEYAPNHFRAVAQQVWKAATCGHI